jgi:hypothetical protein
MGQFAGKTVAVRARVAEHDPIVLTNGYAEMNG